jgi:hypothetical protein
MSTGCTDACPSTSGSSVAYQNIATQIYLALCMSWLGFTWSAIYMHLYCNTVVTLLLWASVLHRYELFCAFMKLMLFSQFNLSPYLSCGPCVASVDYSHIDRGQVFHCCLDVQCGVASCVFYEFGYKFLFLWCK